MALSRPTFLLPNLPFEKWGSRARRKFLGSVLVASLPFENGVGRCYEFLGVVPNFGPQRHLDRLDHVSRSTRGLT